MVNDWRGFLMNIEDNKVGVVAFGVKTGIITFDDDAVDVVRRTFKEAPDLLKNGDILCITEAVVAITQKNSLHVRDVTKDIKDKLKLKDDSKVGILFPIFSRNRFSMVLKAIARSVPKGKVIVQMSFPSDEQGNQIIDKEFVKKIGKKYEDKITLKDIGKNRFKHPETGVDYIEVYQKIIEEQGAKAEIYLSNNLQDMLDNKVNGIIVANVHSRQDTLEKIQKKFPNSITLQDVCSDPKKRAYSEWGLLGSNILDPEKEVIKLAPRHGNKVVDDIQKMVKKEFKKNIEVIIKGDGAYKDPETGIYELADPVSAFGVTNGIKDKNRVGVKTKYLMQKLYTEGKSKTEIENIILKEREKLLKNKKKDSFVAEGTTPRKIENLVASLADLVSGSADANTPIIIVRNFS